MGLCAGLVLLLQPVESWQGVRALANARLMWLPGWLAAGFLLAFWGGAAASFACPTGACWLALAAGGERSGRSAAGIGALAQPWQRGASCLTRLAQGQPLWCVPSQRRASAASLGLLGAQCAGQDALARCPLCT